MMYTNIKKIKEHNNEKRFVMENKRKSLILLILGIFVILIVVVGATYAYFQSVNGNTTIANINATTGTIDNLTFSMDDIDVSTDNIEDNHNIDKEESSKIVINATEENFGKNGKSLGDGIKAKAHLKANNTTNVASSKYNVFFVMEEKENKLIYTMDSKHPELILTVNGPNGEIKEIDGLVYHEKDEKNPNDVSGFDITGKSGSFAIKVGEEIEVTKNDNGEKEEEWEIKVTLINLDNDQNRNTGKEVTGEVVITTDTMETYKLAHINNVSIDEKTVDSITTTLKFDEKGTAGIKEYYFAKEEKGKVGEVVPASLEDVKIWEKESSPTHIFTNLTSDTNYIIYGYAVDNNDFKSNVYETEIIATAKKLPEIKSIEVISKSYNEISIQIESEEGDKGIKEYEYEISGATINPGRIEKDSEKTHTFEGLEEEQEYTIKVRAIDNEGDKSTDSVKTETTEKKMIGNVCKGKEFASCIKENYELDKNIYFHNADLDGGAEDDSYRYAGSDEEVKNYVCLDGGVTTTGPCGNGDADLYRIIGLFKNDSKYEIKLIKYDYATSAQLGEEGAYNGAYSSTKTNYKGNQDNLANIGGYFWTSSDNEVNEWAGSTLEEIGSELRKTNLNDYYLNTYLKVKKGLDIDNLITTHTWSLNGHSTPSVTPKIMYNNEMDKVENSNPSVPTKTKTFPDKIGLMYASDYGYAASPSSTNNWNINLYNYSNYISNNWIYRGLNEWTISRHSALSNRAFYVNSIGYVNTYSNSIFNLAYGVRPCFYLSSSVQIESGDGSHDSPYRLTL